MTPEEAREIDWGVYVILDPAQLHPDMTVMQTARAALRGGASVLQLRDKRASGLELVEQAKDLQVLADRWDAVFIVNDRLDVALAAGADGVHLGPDDVPVRDARRVAPDLIIGGSAGEAPRALELQREGVDYIGCGAIYGAGSSKPDASDPRGPGAIEKLTSSVDVPVVGIGGIEPGNARAVVDAGAAGVAVIRAVVNQSDPEAAARALREAVE